MAMKSKTRYAVLGLLSLYPMSGYDLKKFCDEVVSSFWNENYAHIYKVLKELEKEGLATKKKEQTTGRPEKHIYSITEKGKNELNEWLLKPVEYPKPRFELGLKLYFSGNIPTDNIIGKIKELKKYHEDHRAVYDNYEKMISGVKHIENTKMKQLWLITLNSGRYDSKAVIDWCDETLKILETLK